MSGQVYDDFGKPGYSLTDYQQQWMTPNGPGEMAVEDTRSFGGGRLHVSAVPFQTGSVKAWTPGTVSGLAQLGVYGPSGSWLDPARPPARPEYTARRLQGQQAGVVMNVLDFCTGQVFDWFVASDTAFALIGQWHHLDIALSRHGGQAWVDYLLDHQPVAHVEQIGIPLDKQGVPFTGSYPSAGDGEPRYP